MTQYPEEDRPTVAGVPLDMNRLGDLGAFIELLARMGGGVELDEKQRAMSMGQVFGLITARIAQSAARPWIWLTAVLVLALFILAVFFQWQSFQWLLLMLGAG